MEHVYETWKNRDISDVEILKGPMCLWFKYILFILCAAAWLRCQELLHSSPNMVLAACHLCQVMWHLSISYRYKSQESSSYLLSLLTAWWHWRMCTAVPLARGTLFSSVIIVGWMSFIFFDVFKTKRAAGTHPFFQNVASCSLFVNSIQSWNLFNF